MSATPRPWEAVPSKTEHGETTICIRGQGEFICTMDVVAVNDSPYRLPESGPANAELIVRAVNAHNVLVEALERLKKSALLISVLRQCGGEADDKAWSKLFNDTMNAREVLESLAQAEAAP
jgi:hypothetical protein